MSAFIRALLSLALLLNPSFTLEVNFYKHSCPQAEYAVKGIVKQNFQRDPYVPACLLLLHFHDCIIRGCDGFVLLDSHGNNIAEKEAPPKLNLRGFDLIDEIKGELERRCPGIVSCADILALAARDGVALAGGDDYALPIGRRDGFVSSMTEVHIPDPASFFPTAITAFHSMNLDISDLTTLLGAHSLGFCHCFFFVDRLYDFQGTGFPDPNMDPSILDSLRKNCPRQLVPVFNISSDPKVFINQATVTPFHLDNSFYHGVRNGKDILQLDQELAFTSLTNDMVVRHANNPEAFRRKFFEAMIKLGNVGFLTDQGEIRRNCRKVNKRSH